MLFTHEMPLGISMAACGTHIIEHEQPFNDRSKAKKNVQFYSMKTQTFKCRQNERVSVSILLFFISVWKQCQNLSFNLFKFKFGLSSSNHQINSVKSNELKDNKFTLRIMATTRSEVDIWIFLSYWRNENDSERTSTSNMIVRSINNSVVRIAEVTYVFSCEILPWHMSFLTLLVLTYNKYYRTT